jgi:phosphohistidine phosphatase
MKTLIIVRHAKSSWDYPVHDKDRPLIDVGIESIQKVAKEFVNLLPENFSIWSSTAKRASETATLFCKTTNLNLDKIIFKDALYTFDEHQLEKEIKNCDDSIQNLILFGHNEAITNFVNKYGNKLIYNVPTSGLVMINFDQNNWRDIKNGKTIKTIFPKEIV